MKPETGKDPFRVVVTGGPCAGKTEVWRAMGEAFPHAVQVPEAATRLILAGRSERSMGLERFQRAVYGEQLALEEQALRKGSLLLCDRGLLDGLAYYPGLLSLLGVSQKDLLRRYDMVLQLEVIRDPRLYREHVGNNPARREPHGRALAIERALQRVYEGHPCYAFLGGSLEKKKQEAFRQIRDRLEDLRPELVGKTAGQA
jgi:predicted ATPase